MPTAAAVKKVSSYNLADMMQFQRDCLKNPTGKKDQQYLGRILNIKLGIDDNAEYFRGAAWRRVAQSSKVMGLNIEWKREDAPYAMHAADRQTLLLPGGIRELPTMSTTVFTDIRAEIMNGAEHTGNFKVAQKGELARTPQRLSDFASGRMMGRDGSGFLVLQPIEQIAILAYSISSILILKGHAVDGRWPVLLISPNSPEAYIVGGMLAFD